MRQENRIVLFQEKQIRRVWHNEEWFYVVEDIVAALIESNDPKQYIKRLRTRDKILSEGWVQFVPTLKVETSGGIQKMNCANTEGVFRIIQSIPSQKAEPFKRWLAQVGYERMKEIENPELASKRARDYYKALGYDDAWIEMRLKSIEIREQLTDEWENRGVQKGQEYAILTAEISKATFGMTPTEYKDFKSLTRENLRDHMTNLELIFTMLGEEGTRQTAIKKDALGFEENKDAAKEGGTAAGKARKAYEKQTNDVVSTPMNFKKQIAESRKNRKTLKPPDIDDT